jgi:hypothetical protein
MLLTHSSLANHGGKSSGVRISALSSSISALSSQLFFTAKPLSILLLHETI